MEKLSLVLPERPPYFPRQFGRRAGIGNSGDLLKTKFGKEIDGYDAVFRENGAPIQNFTEYVGAESTFRLLNRGSAKALDKVSELYERGKEVLIVKTTIHDIMNKMIWLIKIHSPTRADPNRAVKWVPDHRLILAARIESEKLLRFRTCRKETIEGISIFMMVGAGSGDPLSACAIIKKQSSGKSTRPLSVRSAAIEHQNT